MSEGNVDVELARFDGRLQSTDVRVRRVEQDVFRVSEKATRLHERLDGEIDQLRNTLTGELRRELMPLKDAVTDLREWRAKVWGIAFGVAVGSGVVSGGIVAAVARGIASVGG